MLVHRSFRGGTSHRKFTSGLPPFFVSTLSLLTRFTSLIVLVSETSRTLRNTHVLPSSPVPLVHHVPDLRQQDTRAETETPRVLPGLVFCLPYGVEGDRRRDSPRLTPLVLSRPSTNEMIRSVTFVRTLFADLGPVYTFLRTDTERTPTTPFRTRVRTDYGIGPRLYVRTVMKYLPLWFRVSDIRRFGLSSGAGGRLLPKTSNLRRPSLGVEDPSGKESEGKGSVRPDSQGERRSFPCELPTSWDLERRRRDWG